MTGVGLELDFLNETTQAVNAGEIKKHLLSILRRLDLADTVRLEVVIVGDKKIQTLNNQFLGHDYPTDVLSFNASDPAEGIGSIVVSVETAERQANRAGVPLLTEINLLAGHGLLHLLGFHHL